MHVNKEELAAIAALRKLATTWPQSLVLVTKVGEPSCTISIRKNSSHSIGSEIDWVSGIMAVGIADKEPNDDGQNSIMPDRPSPTKPISTLSYLIEAAGKLKAK